MYTNNSGLSTIIKCLMEVAKMSIHLNPQASAQSNLDLSSVSSLQEEPSSEDIIALLSKNTLLSPDAMSTDPQVDCFDMNFSISLDEDLSAQAKKIDTVSLPSIENFFLLDPKLKEDQSRLISKKSLRRVERDKFL